ncbi:MAG: Maf family protein [Pseudomonadota bacterium]|nr:Maf family protein [Pseudomonadota bacterium]
MSAVPQTTIVLASSSASRQKLLDGAGIPHSVEPSKVDEEEVKRSMREAGRTGIELAEALAELKAMTISRKQPGKLVLGADQILDCDGKTFDKPRNSAIAAEHLRFLRGKSHQLISYAVIVQDNVRVWSAVETAKITIRSNLSDQFIDNYITRCGLDILSTVGVYKAESLGAQLFSKVQGSHYTILGLPLLPLLHYLRETGVIYK